MRFNSFRNRRDSCAPLAARDAVTVLPAHVLHWRGIWPVGRNAGRSPQQAAQVARLQDRHTPPSFSENSRPQTWHFHATKWVREDICESVNEDELSLVDLVPLAESDGTGL